MLFIYVINREKEIYETQLREIANEEEEMRNNVRKIVSHAENVLDFTELNKEYLDNVLVKHSGTD